MKLFSLFIKIEAYSASDTLKPEINPLIENCLDAKHHRITFYKDIEVTGEAVLKRSELIKLGHKLIGVNASL